MIRLVNRSVSTKSTKVLSLSYQIKLVKKYMNFIMTDHNSYEIQISVDYLSRLFFESSQIKMKRLIFRRMILDAE